MLLRDENVNVVKKAILTMTQLYKVALQVSAPRPPDPARVSQLCLVYRLTSYRVQNQGRIKFFTGKMCS